MATSPTAAFVVSHVGHTTLTLRLAQLHACQMETPSLLGAGGRAGVCAFSLSAQGGRLPTLKWFQRETSVH